MIDWSLVVVVPAAVVAGAELGRRLVPVTHPLVLALANHRLLAFVALAAIVLFVDAAGVAWAAPSQETVWTLVLAAVTGFGAMVLLAGRELRHAHRALQAASADRNPADEHVV